MKKIRAFSDSEFSLPSNATVVSLSPFPPDGEWGGAIRSREIFNSIRELFPTSYVLHCHNLPIKWLDYPEYLEPNHSQLHDVIMLAKDFSTEHFITTVPDAIIFDHPWLWTEAKKLKKRYPETKIIHSSHNIEFRLKGDLLKGLSEERIDETVRYLEDIEIEIAEQADLIVCVTKSDADWFKKMGAKNVVEVNNGTNASLGTVKSTLNYVFVVGSGHPPNVEGAIKYLNNAVNWLPENTDLIIVGTVCDSLHGRLGEERNEARNTTLRLMGKLSDSDLNKLIDSANVIALPVPYGGGSNLKTAEAIVSGRPVVGTSISFRGFEKFKNSEYVRISDDVDEFRELLASGCEAKIPTVYREGSEALTWAGTTKPLKDYLRSISGTSS